jgi:hypothetical protein
MMDRTAVRGIFAALAAASTLLVSEAAAHADDRELCASAADQAQQLRDEGKYRRAREQLLVCARDVCPAPIRRDCLEWLMQVENTAPTVVFGAKESGKDLSDVKVTVDGALVVDHLDGKPIQMDLGKHTVRFEYRGQTKEEVVIIGAGQKNRNVSATFAPVVAPAAPEGPPPAAESRRGSLVPAFIVGGVGVAALGSFAIFGLGGKNDVDDLEKTCKPNCAESDVSAARTKLIIADISLGVGVVALGVATYLILARPRIDTSASGVRAAAGSPPKPPGGVTGLAFDVGALAGGAMGSVHARF